MRVRALLPRDDAHIFCTADQITEETNGVCNLVLGIYRDMGFDDVVIKFCRPAAAPCRRRPDLGTGPRPPCSRPWTRWAWTTPTTPARGHSTGRRSSLRSRDAIGREWQCGTLAGGPEPARPGWAQPTSARDGGPAYAGAAAPCAVRFPGTVYRHPDRALRGQPAPVAGAAAGGGGPPSPRMPMPTPRRFSASSRAPGFVRGADLRNEKINYKVREHSVAKTPVINRPGQTRSGTAPRSPSGASATRGSRSWAWMRRWGRLAEESQPPG